MDEEIGIFVEFLNNELEKPTPKLYGQYAKLQARKAAKKKRDNPSSGSNSGSGGG